VQCSGEALIYRLFVAERSIIWLFYVTAFVIEFRGH